MPEQLPLILPESNWRPPHVPDLPTWAGARRVSVDCETRDPDLFALGPGVRRGAYVVGFSFAIEGGPRFYVPVRHEGGDNVENPAAAWAYFKAQAAAFEGEIVGANLSYDLDHLQGAGVTFPKARLIDVQIAEPLINEHRPNFKLNSLAGWYLDEKKDERLLNEAAAAYGIKKKEVKANLWRMPARYAGPYGEADADLPLRIFAQQEQIIDEVGLRPIFELETRLVRVFHAMRILGVPVDETRLAQVAAYYQEHERGAVAELKRLTGYDLTGNVWVAEACAAALARGGIENLPRTVEGHPSVTQEWLEKANNEAARLLVRARKMNKGTTTFVAQIAKTLVNGRVHPLYHQLRGEKVSGWGEGSAGTVSGRPSMELPNLLQMPIRDPEIGKRFRSVFVAEKGARWAKVDYAQQEPRLTIHFAALMRLPGSEEAVRRYVENPQTDCHGMLAEMTGLPRRTAKELYLGLSYNMGGAKMCTNYLNLPTKFVAKRDGSMIEVAGDEGQAILDRFNDGAPFIRPLMRAAQKKAESARMIKTLLGRHLHFPDDWHGKPNQAHKAGNRLIQGSAADMTKKAMADLFDAGYPMYIQVYDEIDAPVGSDAEAARIAEVMENAVKLQIPVWAEVETGPSWGEVEKPK